MLAYLLVIIYSISSAIMLRIVHTQWYEPIIADVDIRNYKATDVDEWELVSESQVHNVTNYLDYLVLPEGAQRVGTTHDIYSTRITYAKFEGDDLIGQMITVTFYNRTLRRIHYVRGIIGVVAYLITCIALSPFLVFVFFDSSAHMYGIVNTFASICEENIHGILLLVYTMIRFMVSLFFVVVK